MPGRARHSYGYCGTGVAAAPVSVFDMTLVKFDRDVSTYQLPVDES